jgi:uncharacterized protein with gpF-like domain
MIDVSEKDIPKVHAQMLRVMDGFEISGARRFNMVLNKQYAGAARLYGQGVTTIDSAVNAQAALMTEALIVFYQKIAKTFGAAFFDELKMQQKDSLSEYQKAIQTWVFTQAANKVVLITRTTKKLIKAAINKGIAAGESNLLIAKRIVKSGRISNPFRARRIARTETHTASVNAVDQAAKASRVRFLRVWSTTIDERTHGADDEFNHVIANGETVEQDEVFTRTGQALKYPGDPNGSPGNTINCRCVVMYKTVRGG